MLASKGVLRILGDPTAGSSFNLNMLTEMIRMIAPDTGQSARDRESKPGIHRSSHLSTAGAFSTVEPRGEECVH